MMSAFRPNNTVDQSRRASSPELFESHADFYTDDFTQLDYDAIDCSVRRNINPAVYRGDLEDILPAEPPEPISERLQREEEDDDVIFVSVYQNCGKIRFKAEAGIENIPTRIPATDNQAEAQGHRTGEIEASRPPSLTPKACGLPVRRLGVRGGRQQFHKRRILGELANMYAATVHAYASIARTKDL